MERRIFLKQAAITAAVVASARNMSAAKTPSNPIAKRTLGKTGEQLSMIGFGGIVVMNAEPGRGGEHCGRGRGSRHQLL